jgi:hypothetical protein
MTDETWRDVLGLEGHYQVSSKGRVRSLARMVPVRGCQRQRWVQAKILRPSVRQHDGCRQFCLALHGAKHMRSLTVLMVEAGFPVRRGHYTRITAGGAGNRADHAISATHPVGCER